MSSRRVPRPLAAVLFALAAALLGAPATQAAGTITVSYAPVPGQPTQEELVLTGTNDDERFYLGQEQMSDGSPGLTVAQIFGSGVTVVINPGDAARCEPSTSFAGYQRCRLAQPSPSTVKVVRISATLGDGGDLLFGSEIGNVAGTSTPLTVTASGGPGADYLGGGGGNDTLNGDAGTDAVWGNGGNDTLNGGDDPDFVTGGFGDDTIDGGGGDDRRSSPSQQSVPYLTGDQGNDTIRGGSGNDELFGREDNDTLLGEAGNDDLYGEQGTDSLDGGDNDDTLDGGEGIDTFVGGPGTGDAVSYESFSLPGFNNPSTSPGVRVTLDGIANDGPDSDLSTPGIQPSTESVGSDIENITGSRYADELIGTTGSQVLRGLGGPDTLAGGPGDDRLDGGDGDEVFTAEAGADTYVGGSADTYDTLDYSARTTSLSLTLDGIANDGAVDADPGTPGAQPENDNVPAGLKLIAGSGADSFTGSTSGDWFLAGGGADTIAGGAGNDLLDGGPAADTIDGGADTDTVDYSTRTDRVVVNLADPATDGEVGEGDTLTAIEGVKGGGGNDALTIGTVPTDSTSLFTFRSLDGGGGNDVLTGSNGIDTLTGGPGNDTLTGLEQPDRLAGGDGDDQLDGGSGDDSLFGDAQGNWVNPLISEAGAAPPGEGADTIIGGDGSDLLVGGAANDTLQGGTGNDRLQGGIGADQVLGGADTDATDFSARADGVTVTASSGTADDGNALDGPAGARDTIDAVETITGSQQADAITGTPGNDTLKGLSGDDQLLGLGGDDTLDGGDLGNGGNGADVLDGGQGFDTVTYGGNQGGGANISLDGVQNDGRGDETPDGRKDNVLGFESVIGSAGNDVITATDADERIAAGAGADTINSGGGNDTIIAGDGADTVNAGAGNDLISSSSSDPTTPTWGVNDGARDTVDAGPGDDTVIPQDGGTGANANVYIGGQGDDTFSLVSEIQPSRLSQDGLANDGVLASGASDNISEFEVLEGSQVNDTLTGGGGVRELRGLGGADTINGSAAAEVLGGDAGDDTLNGGEGDDTLDGGTGKDTLTGDGGNDTATYADRVKDVKVTLDGVANDGQLDVNPGLAGNQPENDNVKTEGVVGGLGADQFTGDAAANTLRGGPGADVLDGAAGDDTLDGGPGSDQLRSGTGTDVLDAADGEADTLTCDVQAGKTIRVDAALDLFSTCAVSAPLGEVLSEGRPPFTPPVDTNGTPLTPLAGVGSSEPAGQAPRPARELAAGLRARGAASVARAGAALAVGSATCAAGRTCTLSAQLLAGKRPVGSGTVSGTGKLTATLRLTARGWSTVRRTRTARFTLVLTVLESGSQATVKRPFTLRLAGGGR